MTKRLSHSLVFTVSLIIFFVLVWLSLNFGAVRLDGVWGLIFGKGSAEDLAIMQEIRIPRVLAAIIVGASLGIAGTLSQGALRNPLAEPVLLGTTGGASLFTLLGILLGHVSLGTPPAIALGIAGALIATVSTYQMGKGGRDGLSFVVMGLAVSATLTAVVGITAVMINQPEARGVTFWTLGTLSLATKSQTLLLLPIAACAAIGAVYVSNDLDYLSLGDLRAKHLGKEVSRIRFITFAIIALSVGAITSIFGQISFLALAIPHISRTIVGVRHRILILHSALIGASLLLLADLGARTLASPNELPLGLMSALIGAPILMISVRRWFTSNA